MSLPVRTRRKNKFNFVKEAERLESFDEFPMLRSEVDPQLHVSRNQVDQPFHLICEKDCVLAQANGRSRVVFVDGPVRYFDMTPGDFVYVPGRTAHRVLSTEPGVLLRYKAREPGTETMLWLCETCGAELGRDEADATAAPAQVAYAAATLRFNADDAKRCCGSCGTRHPPVDATHFRWEAVGEALMRAEDDGT